MSEQGVHEKDCLILLKSKHSKVHEFLDQFVSRYPPTKYAEYHRSFLHNSYGVKIIRGTFGEEAYKAALVHLYRDWTYLNPTSKELQYIIDKTEREILMALDQFKYMELPVFIHI